ncbi:hypothetical protein OIU77_006592 [Salix suchowensis]|uniref:Uncharacterized protein n=1 Tax=Salix suchowensis TaxID=1278906 RepID=A0ABQ9AL68_9ROSI|nr:hypothetical protein OIU77_006592 [Salix suchowensis]
MEIRDPGWEEREEFVLECLSHVHSLSLRGELDFEDYMIEDRSCTFLERVELGFQLKLENLGRIKVDDEPFEKLFENFW